MRAKPKMPAKLRAQAATAIERHQSRPITPDVSVTADAGGWSYASPYSASDELGWCALIRELWHPAASGRRRVREPPYPAVLDDLGRFDMATE